MSPRRHFFFFFFNDTATTEIYTLSLHDALPISDEILREWEWSEHFAAQPETLRYCNFVADKLDLRRDIEFGCRIRAAVYDEAAGDWEIESEDGRRARARFLITAIGPLSVPTMPTIL